MLRTLWFLLNLIVYTVWYASKAVIAGLLGVPNKPGGVYDQCARIWSQRMIKVSGVDLRVSGYENVPDDRPVIYVSNHQSFFDIWALATVVPGQTRFVAKKELQQIPILGRAMRAAGHIYIDRQNRQAAFSAYEEAAAYIKRGMSAVLFPEGTRSLTGELLPFKKGPFVLALAAQVPIIPVYCAGTFTLMPKGSMRLSPHPIALLFGEPIPTEGLDYEDREKLMTISRKAIEQLRVDSEGVLG
jgi:1-acyl-sn-glycerol-3-phosphate acyltransferase